MAGYTTCPRSGPVVYLDLTGVTRISDRARAALDTAINESGGEFGLRLVGARPSKNGEPALSRDAVRDPHTLSSRLVSLGTPRWRRATDPCATRPRTVPASERDWLEL